MVVAVSYLVRYDTLLQNVKYIMTKCGNYFITKCSEFLQNATVITKCDVYYKLPCYKRLRKYTQHTITIHSHFVRILG